MSNMFKILAIDGGGIRGVLPARILVELERLAGRPIAELFDVIAGTSTGGIIALTLTRPGPAGRPRYPAEEVLALYTRRGREIFPHVDPVALRLDRSSLDLVRQRVGALILPARYGNARYRPGGLQRVLLDVLGDARLGEATTDVVVTSYDWKAGRSFVFRSREATSGLGPNPMMRDVARATSAAPTYFPPHRLRLDDGNEVVLIDGGVAANNPVSLGYYEGLIREEEERRDLDMYVVSLGTGRPPEEIPTYEELWAKGWLSLGMGMLGIVFDGTSEIQDDLMRKVIQKKEPGSRYFRFQTELRGCSLRLDDASPRNVAGLLRLGERMIAEQKDDLASIAEFLVGDAPARPEVGGVPTP
jgi:uncharacterized protein